MVSERKIMLILGIIMVICCLLDLLCSLTADNSHFSRERSALELCPEASARDYCIRPVYMMGTGCAPRVPTVQLPYCPKP